MPQLSDNCYFSPPHNPKVVGSSPSGSTLKTKRLHSCATAFFVPAGKMCSKMYSELRRARGLLTARRSGQRPISDDTDTLLIENPLPESARDFFIRIFSLVAAVVHFSHGMLFLRKNRGSNIWIYATFFINFGVEKLVNQSGCPVWAPNSNGTAGVSKVGIRLK